MPVFPVLAGGWAGAGLLRSLPEEDRFLDNLFALLKGWSHLDGTLSLLIAMAWPVVTLAIVLIFRRDFARALGRVGRFKYRDLEVTFLEDLRQAEDLARSLPATPMNRGTMLLEIETARDQPFVRKFATSVALSDERQSLQKLAMLSPRKAIDAAGNLVGRVLARCDRSRLAEAEVRLVDTIRMLQERAVKRDDNSPSPEEARRFVDLACQIASRIDVRG